MGDVLDAVSARIKAPYFGYAVLAFVAFNWRAIFLLVMTEATPVERLAIFDAHTSNWTLFFAPLLAGVVVASIAAWIRLAFEHISKNPLEKITRLQLDAEHKQDIEKNRLAQIFSTKQDLLIDDAKKDQEIQRIEDEVIKLRLQQEIENLREERDQKLGSQSVSEFDYRETALLQSAAKYGEGEILVCIYVDDQYIQSGASTLGKKDKKDFKLFEDALKELVRKGLVEQKEKGLFELTGRGWEAAEQIP